MQVNSQSEIYEIKKLPFLHECAALDFFFHSCSIHSFLPSCAHLFVLFSPSSSVVCLYLFLFLQKLASKNIPFTAHAWGCYTLVKHKHLCKCFNCTLPQLFRHQILIFKTLLPLLGCRMSIQ